MADIACDAAAKEHFIDGDDVCADCARCCQEVAGLLVTMEELECLPLMKPFVTSSDGHFHRVNFPEACPYLKEDRRCETFESRPFDCSLYPLTLVEVRREPGDLAAKAIWKWGAHRCPQRAVFVRRGVSDKQMERFRQWVASALGTEDIRLREVTAGEHLRQAGQAFLQSHAAVYRLRRAIRRVVGR